MTEYFGAHEVVIFLKGNCVLRTLKEIALFFERDGHTHIHTYKVRAD